MCDQLMLILQVNINGIISFDGAVSAFVPTPFPLSGSTILIAPYWADIDTRGIGTVWYRETSSPDLLTRANTQIRNAFPTSTFTATRLFIAGWYTVGYFNANTDLVSVYKSKAHCILYIYIYIRYASIHMQCKIKLICYTL